MIEEVRIRPLATPALLIGIGLGGFLDLFVIQQLLRWPSSLSIGVHAALAAASWLCAFVGVVMLFRAARRDDVVWSARIFAGALLVGWGLFNIVDGLLEHLVLAIVGVVLALAGFLVGRSEMSGTRMSPATRHALGL